MQAVFRQDLAWPGDDSIRLVVTSGAQYNEALQQLAHTLLRRFTHGVALSANRPHHLLREGLTRAGVENDGLEIIDCVSAMTGVEPTPAPGVTFIESPTMMEKLAMRGEQKLRRMTPGARFMLVDSLSTLSVYNGPGPVAEFAHNLVTRLRLHRIPAGFLLVEKQNGEDLVESIRPLMDDVVHF